MTGIHETQNRFDCFHIHVDGARVPEVFEQYLKTSFGFYDDNFEHELKIQDSPAKLPGRQMTLKVLNRFAGRSVRRVCSDLSDRARCLGFSGIIQSEFVMRETVLRSEKPFARSEFPFTVKTRKLDSSKGERFKSHEFHLELNRESCSPALIETILGSGLAASAGPDGEITFTASGKLNHVQVIHDSVREYLKSNGGYETAKMTLEATVFSSLHGILPEDTHQVVESIALRN